MCVCVCVCACVCVHMCAHVCVHGYIDTHIQIQLQQYNIAVDMMGSIPNKIASSAIDEISPII